MNAEALLRTRVRFSPPPPIHKGQPLSVGLFLCGVLRVCGGFCGSLRTSPPASVHRSRRSSILSWPFFSRPSRRQNLEVRKHRKSGRYKSEAYSRTFQAVGWRHCLPRGNHQPTAIFRVRYSGIAASACSIRLIMPYVECRAASFRACAGVKYLITYNRSWRHQKSHTPREHPPGTFDPLLDLDDHRRHLAC
jgi:hypothetical protein